MNKYVTEFIGTFLFVFSVALAAIHAGALAPLAIGGALACVVAIGSRISGGHTNPAITLAVYLRGRIGGAEALAYGLAQIVGAAVASAVAGLVTGRVFLVAPIARSGLVAALIVEVVFAGFLALGFLHFGGDEARSERSIHGLVLGVTLTVGLVVGGSIAAGAFNPAVALGPAIAAAGSAPIGHVWLHAAGPLLGGALAAAIHRAQQPTIGPWGATASASGLRRRGEGPLS